MLFYQSLFLLEEFDLIFHDALVVRAEIQLEEEFVMNYFLEMCVKVYFSFVVNFLLDQVLCFPGPLH